MAHKRAVDDTDPPIYQQKIAKIEYPDCSICCDPLKKSTQVNHCCQINVCKGCVKQWILSTETVSCMQCKRPISYLDMVGMVGVSWATDEFKEHRRTILFRNMKIADDRVRIVLSLDAVQQELKAKRTEPNSKWFRRLLRKISEQNTPVETLSIVKKYLSVVSIYTSYISYIMKRGNVDEMIRCHERARRYLNIINEYGKVEGDITRPWLAAWDIEPQAPTPVPGQAPAQAQAQAQAPAQNQPNIRGFPCPRTGCMGIVMKSSGKCTMCNLPCCLTCLEPISADEEHECDPETVATIQVTDENSTRCPRCTVSIQKSSGCNQMYCTQCGQFFDYRSGNPISGLVHNPHALAVWCTVNIGCNRTVQMPQAVDIMRNYGLKRSVADAYLTSFREFVRRYNERTTVMSKYPIRNVNDPYLRARTQYHLGLMDPGLANGQVEETFRKKIHIIEKASEKTIEFGLLIRTIVDSVGDILQRLNSANFKETMFQIRQFCIDMKPNVDLVRKNFGCQVPLWIEQILVPATWKLDDFQ